MSTLEPKKKNEKQDSELGLFLSLSNKKCLWFFMKLLFFTKYIFVKLINHFLFVYELYILLCNEIYNI